MAAQSTTSSRRARPRRTRRLLGNLLYALVMLVVLLFLLAPFLWMVLNAFKSPLQIIKLPPELIFEPTLRNFQNVFGTQNFMRYIMNSVIIGAGCTLFGLLIGLPAAYSIARYRQNRLAIVILMARMVPGITFLVPLFIIFRRLGLIDTYTSLILAHMLVGLPFIVWVMVPFFESIPRELTEAAVMDGASAVRTFVARRAAAERAGHRDGRRSFPLSSRGITSCSPSCWRRARRALCRSRSTTSSPTRRSTGAG